MEQNNHDLISKFQSLLNEMKSNEIATVQLRYLDVSIILTYLKTFDFYARTFEEQMKTDFAKIKMDSMLND